MESKEIKVYGTLVNHTLLAGDLPINTTATNHNDVIAYAYQLYDDRFSSTASENYQDVINKRLTGITYDPLSDTTTIDNNLIVNGDTNINGDTHIDGDTTIEGDLHVTESFVVDGDISGISLGNLSNVSSTADSASAGTFLKFDGSEWVPAVIALSDIDGFDSIGTPSEGDIIKYVNNQWTFTKNKLDELYDVDITNKANGSILKWNSTSNKWEMGTDSIGSILPAGDEGQVLKYINGLWVAADDLTGDALPEGSEGKVLKYINGSWVAGDDNDTKQLSALNDVTLSTMAVGQVLRYNGSKWANAKLSINDLEMPAATAGLVLKFNGTKWVAAEDEVGESGGIPSGDNYPTLKKYRVKMNLIATCVPSVMAAMSENDSIVKSQDCTTYLYKSENDINIGLGEIVLASGIESFNNDQHYVKYFAESAQSLLLSYGKINYTDDIVNGSPVNATNSFGRYLIAPSIQQSATTNDVLYINNWYYSLFYFDYFSKNNKTLRQVGNNKDVYIAPSCGFPYLYSSCIRPSDNLLLQGYADISHVTIENGKYVGYHAVKDYENRYSGLLTGPYYKQIYNNDKHDVDGYTHITSTITNISESEFRNNVKWNNGETFIHIPEKSPFAILTESSNIQMPDYIYGYITTIS